MSNYGLTEFGFVLKRFPEILQDLRDELLAEFPDAAIADDQVIGHLLDIYAKEPAELWELAEAVYKSRAPSSADGIQLDDVGQINAIPRKKAQSAVVYESFTGTNGTIIPLWFRFKRTDTSNLFQPTIASALDSSKTSKTIVDIIAITNEHTYIITIDASSVQYISDASATIEEIRLGIIGAINDQTDFLKVHAAEESGSNSEFNIISNDGESAYELTLTSDFTLKSFWTPIRCKSVDKIALEAPANTLTEIVTPISGLDSIINFADALPGSNVQSDSVYRQRLFTETRRLGGGSLEAIKDRILNEVKDVILVKAFENDTILTDSEGRPPKSIEILVEGGTDIDIANELWYVKSGGIETFGAINVQITDSQGDFHIINFSRPIKKYVHFNITLSVGPTFPSNGVQTIRENIVLLGRDKFGIGDLLLIQEFYCPIYDVEGVTNATIEWGVTDNPGDTPTYVTTNIQLDDRSAPLFDLSRTLVSVV